MDLSPVEPTHDGTVAQQLVSQLPNSQSLDLEHHKSKLYTYYGDAERFVLVAGDELDSKQASWALLYGLSERHGRRLQLVLPKEEAFATRQRAPWMTEDARPEILIHANGAIEPTIPWSRQDTINNVTAWAKSRPVGSQPPGPEAEFKAASTPAHLGDDSERVRDLVEWATIHPQLDASHVQGSRSWHCAGQKVLTLENRHHVIKIRAGIHDKARTANPDVILAAGTSLTEDQLAALKSEVLDGIQDRLAGDFRKPDEHWLQSVLRRNPSVVGVETPALREVPAWRPSGADGQFGRGFLDLLGLDGHGDIRLVEAKLAKSTDDMTLMQGLDYHVWARAYEHAIRNKLSAPERARLRLHYVVGVAHRNKQLLPARVYKYADSLDTKAVPFRFHVVRGWDTLLPDERPTLQPQLWTENALPSPDGPETAH